MSKRRIFVVGAVAVALIGVSTVSAYALHNQNKVKQIAPQHPDYPLSEGVS